jgi:hypothetical protein
MQQVVWRQLPVKQTGKQMIKNSGKAIFIL